MLRAIRLIVLGIIGAAVGAFAGRLAADVRRQIDAGLAPSVDPSTIELRPRDVVPGLLAAMRSGDRPWSYLHIPAWFVAFAVNFALAAFSEELEPLRKAAGLDLFDGGEEHEDDHAEPAGVDYVEVEASEVSTDGQTGTASF
ncbi:MAG: hypothetical protein R3C39_15925 [Dehalococcoidia bacterium]